MIETPVPFSEEDISPENRFWKPEPFDKFLPEPGFLTDLILATRGVETPTLLSFWSGIWLLSSVLKRDAYFRWFPEPLYPNFFIVLVAPPRICAKTTVVSFGTRLLTKYPELYPDPRMSFAKEITLLRSKATPEAMEEALRPKENIQIKFQGKDYLASKGSEASIAVGELATFLGKQKYNTGLVNNLVNLYDCQAVDSSSTVTRGSIIFRDIYLTLIGATTITGINESIPDEAMGGGFVSRLIFVHSPTATRSYPAPMNVIGGPSKEELTKRLAWIGNNAQGEYFFSPEAEAYYNTLYVKHRKKLEDEDPETMDMKSRYDIHLRKLALILKAQRYEKGNEISLEILQNAQQILDFTYATAKNLTKDVGATPYTKAKERAQTLIKQKGKITRRQLLQRLSPYGINADTVLKIVQHIHQEGKIDVFLRGKQMKFPSTVGEEQYRWDG